MEVNQKATVVFINDEAQRQLDIYKVADIQDKAQTWLWQNFIPLETCTLIAGVPGIGKSQLLLYLAAAVSNGINLKLNSIDYRFEKGSVLILACEDNEKTAIKPRLTALGANADKIYWLKSTSINTDKRNKKLIALDQDLELLREKIKEIGDVKLVIIDPISGFLGKTRDHIDSEVRNLLSSLNDLAEENNLAIVLNKHLRKKGSGQTANAAIDEVSGSGAWVAVVRQSFLISEYADDPNKTLMINLKVNINKKNREAFSYQIQPHDYTNNNGEIISATKIVWDNGVVSITADEAMNRDTFEKGKLQIAVDFITEYLEENGQSMVFNVLNAALEAGISKPTFYRAKDSLAIEEKKGISGKKMWNLIKD